VEELRANRARGRLFVAAFAAATMLIAPLVLLHAGAATGAATPAGARAGGHGTALGTTQLVAANTPVHRASRERLAAHRSAVRHNEEVWRARSHWHRMRVHLEAVAAHRAYVAWLVAHHDAAVAAAARRRQATAVEPSTGTHVAVGAATWYAWHPGQCASPFLPHGTVLRVTDLATGVTITCLVTDTEAHNPGRVVDLSNWCFQELAPLAQGVIEVRITW
jgi:rare lipoprotein A (peptidoglycan hydrolase)